MADHDAPLVHPVSPAWKQRRIVAAVVAAALGIGVWAGRNVASDAAYFASVTSGTPSAAALEGYIKHGWRSVEAARAALPRAALDQAKRDGSVTALRAFLKTDAESPLAAEARTALQATYAAALAKYQGEAPADGPGANAIGAVLRAAEANDVARLAIIEQGPSEEVFRTLDRVASPGPLGYDLMPIAGFFRPTQAALAQRINAPLHRAFAAVFPPDILTTHTPNNAAIPDHEPRLIVEYTMPPTARFATMDTRAFVLFSVRFRARMYVASTTVLDLPLTIEPLPSMTVQGSGVMVSSSDVYLTIQRRAFDEMANALVATFFARSSQTYRTAMGSPTDANTR